MPAKRKLPPGVYTSGLTHYQFRVTLPKDPATGTRPQIVRGGFTSPEAAYAAREAYLAGERNPAVLSGTAPRPETVAEYLPRFLALHRCGDNTRRAYRWRMGYVVAGLGDVPLTTLSIGQVQDWLDTLAVAVSPATARAAREFLVLALNRLVRAERLPRNVAALATPPSHTRSLPTILRGNELATFLRALDAESAEQRALWLLALYGQLRAGELAGLCWRDVDTASGAVTVARTRTRGEDHRPRLGQDAKTPAGRRTVALPAVVVAALKAHRVEQAAHRLSAPIGYDIEDHGLVFPGRRGRVAGSSGMEARLARLCRRAGVPVVTPHDLRHAGASLLIELGVDAKTVAERLGHASPATTLTTYVHPSRERHSAAAELLGEALEKLRKLA